MKNVDGCCVVLTKDSISTNVAPAYNTSVQAKQKLFKKKFNSELVIKEKQHTVTLSQILQKHDTK